MQTPLLGLLARHPAWLAEHAAAYAVLIGEEARQGLQQQLSRAAWWLLAVCSALAAVLLGGVALMLWQLLGSGAPPRALPVLWTVALLPWATGLLSAWRLWRHVPTPLLAETRRQLQADLGLWQDTRP